MGNSRERRVYLCGISDDGRQNARRVVPEGDDTYLREDDTRGLINKAGTICHFLCLADPTTETGVANVPVGWSIQFRGFKPIKVGVDEVAVGGYDRFESFGMRRLADTIERIVSDNHLELKKPIDPIIVFLG